MPSTGRGRRSVHFRVVCTAAVGCVVMGMQRERAVPLCVTCGQLTSANLVAPRQRKCVACRGTQPGRADSPGTPHDPHAAVRARAQTRRCGAWAGVPGRLRRLYRTERDAIPRIVPADRARKRAVSRALRALERQHRPRYAKLYQQELMRARSQPGPRRLGRPPGTADRLTIAPEARSTWSRDGLAAAGPASKGREPSSGPGCRRSGKVPPTCSPKGCRRPRSLANSASPGRPRSGGTPAGEAVGPQRCKAVAPAAIPRFPTVNCRRSNGRS
jgi:hypothetical protein